MQHHEIAVGGKYRDSARGVWVVDKIDGQKVKASKIAPDDCSWVTVEMSLGRFAATMAEKV